MENPYTMGLVLQKTAFFLWAVCIFLSDVAALLAWVCEADVSDVRELQIAVGLSRRLI